jgi:hypothetical protein
LTHEQYSNTVHDLFGIDERAGNAFAPDALNGFAFTNSVNFVVDGRLTPQYRNAAEALAARAVSETAIFERIVACEAPAAACRDQFIAEFGLRAFRRPLTAAETERLNALFDQGPDLVASGDAFRDGVQLVVEAALQAPQFIYRTELSNDGPQAELIALDPYEVASRLSYFIYDSMPDPELFAAAGNGDLGTSEQIADQITRMLSNPQAMAQLVQFHKQAWQFGQYLKIAPDSDLYPDAPSDLAARALAASEAYVREVIERGGGAQELLSETFAYADPALAALYGQQIDGDLQRIELDPKERRGLLTQVGFLASHAYTRKTDPIHRGLFVIRDLLCRGVGDPPPGASMKVLPADTPAPKTTREEVTLLTASEDCSVCHSFINPPGFAFEAFDAMGQSRSNENGNALDTSGTIRLDGTVQSFQGATDLVQLLAASDEAQRCYANKWLAFALGREPVGRELALVDPLARRLSVVELVTRIAADANFLTRTPNEVSP